MMSEFSLQVSSHHLPGKHNDNPAMHRSSTVGMSVCHCFLLRAAHKSYFNLTFPSNQSNTIPFRFVRRPVDSVLLHCRCPARSATETLSSRHKEHCRRLTNKLKASGPVEMQIQRRHCDSDIATVHFMLRRFFAHCQLMRQRARIMVSTDGPLYIFKNDEVWI